jgi:hypothetical protein
MGPMANLIISLLPIKELLTDQELKDRDIQEETTTPSFLNYFA